MSNAKSLCKQLEIQLARTNLAVNALQRAIYAYEQSRRAGRLKDLAKQNAIAAKVNRQRITAREQLKNLNLPVVMVHDLLASLVPKSDPEKPVFIEHVHRGKRGKTVVTIEYQPKYDTVERLMDPKKYAQKDVLPGYKYGEPDMQTEVITPAPNKKTEGYIPEVPGGKS